MDFNAWALGDCWAHGAFDPEQRLVVPVVPGERTAAHVQRLVADCQGRTGGRVPSPIPTAEDAAYPEALLRASGETVVPPRAGKPGRPQAPYQVPPKALHDATVHKTRKKGRGVKIDYRIICGTEPAVPLALSRAPVSRAINTAFGERQNGTDRNRNARKVRKTYCFSKAYAVHEAMTYLTMDSYNFCWAVRTLRRRAQGEARGQPCTPAIAAGLADHV